MSERRIFDALEVPDFRRFWTAALVSNSGAWLQALASPFVMKRITDSATWIAIAAFTIALPMALVGPFAGPLSDRISRRNILLVTQSILIFAALGYAALWWGGVRTPLPYVLIGLFYGVVNGFNMPAWQAYVADLVPRDRLMNAITLNSAQFNAARALGPSLGGVVLALFGPGWCYTINGLSFLGVVATLLTLPAAAPSAAPSDRALLSEFGDALRYARTVPGIRTAYLSVVVLGFLGGTLVQVFLVLFAEDVFGVSEVGFGMLVSAFGVGAICATPFIGKYGPGVRRSVLIVAGLGVYGLGEMLLTSSTVFWLGCAGVFMCGAAHITVATTNNTSIQLIVAEEMRGRIVGAYVMLVTASMPLGAIVQGPLADVFGPRPVVATVAGLFVLSAVWLGASGRAKALDFAVAVEAATEPRR